MNQSLWKKPLVIRAGLVLTLTLGLSACAQMVEVSPQQSSSDAIAVQAGRERILALSPAVNEAQLAPVKRALAAARSAQSRGEYLLAERETLLAKILLDNIQTRLKASPGSSRRQALQSQIANLQSQIASTHQKIDATKAQIAKESQ
ncbi:hypothetical protein ACJU26_15605 [Acidithiobacillus sp. M4-SHS-6]|uniref:hypothetical protein n=1 Tax=Acidithiobacillus sp. M4-SHS-6 TaxID=3383024 RepID=UPI0039BDE33C